MDPNKQFNQAFAEREHMYLSPIVYKSFAWSLAICLLLSTLVLVGRLHRSLHTRHQTRSTIRYTASAPSSTMSDTKDDSVPVDPMTQNPQDLLLQNPLAGTYLPITSGQMAALVQKRAAQAKKLEGQGVSAASVEEDFELNALELKYQAFVRFLGEEPGNDTWQKRILTVTSTPNPKQ